MTLGRGHNRRQLTAETRGAILLMERKTMGAAGAVTMWFLATGDVNNAGGNTAEL